MKTLLIAILIFNALYFAACGSDNPVNNTGNPPSNNDSLIWSIDSFTVYSSHSPRMRDFAKVETLSVSRKYRVNISATSNVPSSSDTAVVWYTCYPYPFGSLIQLVKLNSETQNLNVDYSFTVDSTQSTYTQIMHYFEAGFTSTYPTNLNYYIKVNKFQLYLVR